MLHDTSPDLVALQHTAPLTIGRSVLNQSAQALQRLALNLDHHFSALLQTLADCPGHLIIMGVGKSGHIARKIAASLASLGSPAYFIHPTEALHGDLGMIQPQDHVLFLSHSGTTEELIALIHPLQNRHIRYSLISSNARGTLSHHAQHVLCYPFEKESCSLGLAPTTSTTLMLGLGDALAVTLSVLRHFTAQDFARYHPSGHLGKQLCLQVQQLMHPCATLHPIHPHHSILDSLHSMTQTRLGVSFIVDPENPILLGLFTDGDLRRTLEKSPQALHDPIAHYMTKHFHATQADALAHDAFQLFRQFKINVLPVLNSEKKWVGALHLHDLLQAGWSL